MSKVKRLVGAAMLPVWGSLYAQPFALLELGAYVVAITVAMYCRLRDRAGYNKFKGSSKYILVVMVGLMMIVIVGQLEAALLGHTTSLKNSKSELAFT